MQTTQPEEILIGVAKLLDKQTSPIFSRHSIRDELCIFPENWNASYSPTFQAMRSDHPGGAPPIGIQYKNVFQQVSYGKHTLTEYGRHLLDEMQRQKVTELLQFLPHFERRNKLYIKEWVEGRYPIYDEDVRPFYNCAGHSYWSDFHYKPEESVRMLEDEQLLRHATMSQFRAMLTYCVRGERFGEGHWAAMLESGKVQALLHRLQQLKGL
jgi:hypothetical protein